MATRRSSAGKGPGRYWRENLSLIEFFDRFPDEEAAEEFVSAVLWPDGPRCHRRDGDNVNEPGGKAPMRYRCRPCRRYFSLRSGTVIRDSTISYRKWPVVSAGIPRQWGLRRTCQA